MPSPSKSRQGTLPLEAETFSPSRVAKRSAIPEEQNYQAAEIILAEPARYGGEDTLMVRWARAVKEAQG